MTKKCIIAVPMVCIIMLASSCAISNADIQVTTPIENNSIVLPQPSVLMESKQSQDSVYYPVNLDIFKIFLGMGLEDVEEILGEPTEISTGPVGTEFEYKLFYYYESGGIRFTSKRGGEDYIVDAMSIKMYDDSIMRMSGSNDINTLLTSLQADVNLDGEGYEEIEFEGNSVGYAVYNDAGRIERIVLSVNEELDLLEIDIYQNTVEAIFLRKSDDTISQPIVNINKKIFLPTEASIFNLPLGSNENDVKSILGEPKKETKVLEQEVDTLKTGYYDFGYVKFLSDSSNSKYRLYGINIDQPLFKGPRDVQVNDSFENAAEKLGIQLENIDNEDGIIYQDYNRLAEIEYNKNNEPTRISYWFGDGAEFALVIEDGVVKRIMIYWMRD